MLESKNFVKIVLAPEILTPTEFGSVGAPQHHWFYPHDITKSIFTLRTSCIVLILPQSYINLFYN